MVRHARQAHLSLLDEYLRERRARVDSFMEHTWIPEYIDRFSKEAKLEEELSKAKTPRERGQVLQEFNGAANQEIAARRATLMEAVETVGQGLRERLVEHYDQMEGVNTVLTAHLRSAAKVTATRDKLLETVNLPVKKILPLDKVGKVLDKIERFEKDAQAIGTLVDQAKGIITQREVDHE
ncbi:hypothetical protein ACFL2T_00270 [Elusimicrobiota bacterium]